MGEILGHESTPTCEPTRLRAGDTWRWNRTISDHLPSDGWTLAYTLRRGSAEITITATGSEDVFEILVPASATDDYAGGPYRLVGRVSLTEESGAEPEVYTIYDARVDVLADPANDTLSHAEQMVAKIEAELLAASNSSSASGIRRWREGNVEEEYATLDRQYLMEQLGYWREMVRQQRGGRAIETMRGAFVYPR